MPIALDHTIVPARDKVAAARFFAETFGQCLAIDFGKIRQLDSHHRVARLHGCRTRALRKQLNFNLVEQAIDSKWKLAEAVAQFFPQIGHFPHLC